MRSGKIFISQRRTSPVSTPLWFLILPAGVAIQNYLRNWRSVSGIVVLLRRLPPGPGPKGKTRAVSLKFLKQDIGLWDYPWIPWVFGIASLALARWSILEGAWWQWVVGIFFCCLGIVALRQAMGLTLAQVVWRRRRKSVGEE